MRADEDSETDFANAIYQYKRTLMPEELVRIATLVVGK
jgi:hypothetical protein